MNLLPVDLAADAVNAYDLSYPWTKVLTYGDSYIGLLIDSVNKRLRVACQGTANLEDARKDAESLIPTLLPKVGQVPDGFQIGMPETYAEIRGIVTSDWIVTLSGHSLGGGQVADLASMFIADGLTPSAICMLASPRTGAAVAGMLAKCRNVYSFVNGPDPVPNLPLFWSRPVTHPIILSVPPLMPLIDVQWHSSALYLKGIAALALPAFATLPIGASS